MALFDYDRPQTNSVVKQYSPDDTSYAAQEARRKSQELQSSFGKALAQDAAKKEESEIPKLISVPKMPVLNKAFDSLTPAIQNLMKGQQQAQNELKTRQADVTAKFQSALDADVSNIGQAFGKYEAQSAKDLAERERLTEARRLDAERQAAGLAERYGASQPGMGLSSDALRFLGQTTAQAQLPFAQQIADLRAARTRDLYDAERSLIGKRGELLSGGYNFLRGLADDASRLMDTYLGTLGRSADVYDRMNFLGLQAPEAPRYSLPSYSRFVMPQNPQFNRFSPPAVAKEKEDKPAVGPTRRAPEPVTVPFFPVGGLGNATVGPVVSKPGDTSTPNMDFRKFWGYDPYISPEPYPVRPPLSGTPTPFSLMRPSEEGPSSIPEPSLPVSERPLWDSSLPVSERPLWDSSMDTYPYSY
jgi:hypothetical protein